MAVFIAFFVGLVACVADFFSFVSNFMACGDSLDAAVAEFIAFVTDPGFIASVADFKCVAYS